MAEVLEESYGIIPLKKSPKGWEVFLVQLKSGKHWGFPKGHGNGQENPKEIAKRELFEETRLQVKRFLRLQPFIERYSYRKNRDVHHKTVYYFLAEVVGKVKIQEEELLDGKWVELIKAKEQITHSESRRLCEEVIRWEKDRKQYGSL